MDLEERAESGVDIIWLAGSGVIYGHGMLTSFYVQNLCAVRTGEPPGIIDKDEERMLTGCRTS